MRNINELVLNLREKNNSSDMDETNNKSEIDYYLNNASSQKIELDKFPQFARDVIDNISTKLIQVDNNFVLVVGHPRSGKSFFIEQTIYNIDNYIGKTNDEPMHFIAINDINMIELGNATRIKQYSNSLMKDLGAKRENICFVTESPEAAMFISTVLPKHKIILEINSDTYHGIVVNTNKSTSKTWRSWGVVDINSAVSTQKELVELLQISIVKRLNEKFSYSLKKTQINSIINSAIELIPDITDEFEDEEYVMIPPGIWATIVRKFMTNYVYASDPIFFKKDGNHNFNRIKRHTLYECLELFHSFSHLREDDREGPDDAQEEIIEIIRSLGGNVINISELSAGGAVTPPKEVTPLVFKDVQNLDDRLKEDIIGQDKAIESVSSSMLVPAAGLNDPNKPIRSFLFMGKTGVGKTQLALDLAEKVAEEKMNVVRIDMSEYQQPHEVAKLFGAPPGYLGFDKGGTLTNAVAENPQSIVLLDEIEKANEKVWDSFLQVLDSGRMTDSMGNVIDFSQTIIIMTSNIGAGEASKKKLGFGTVKDVPAENKQKEVESIVMKELELLFKPELINRIDDIIVFNSLDKKIAQAIVKKEINIVKDRLASKEFDLVDYNDDVIDIIIDKSDIEKYGAREIQRVVFKNISKPLAEYIVRNSDERTFILETKDNEITINTI